MAELRQIAAQYGGYSAIALDGGGSTTLVAQDNAGRPLVLNSPIDNHFAGRERPVANHLGVYAAAAKP
jgi:exopolysaccharide biosynthesis protein